MSGLEIILIAANLGGALVGFIASNVFQHFSNKKRLKKNTEASKNTSDVLNEIKSMMRPSPSPSVETPTATEPYGHARTQTDIDETYYELKPYYNAKTIFI